MKLCWLIPDDRGGGVASVALSCCRQAAQAGYETTLLLVLSSTEWIKTDDSFQISSLGLSYSAQETPTAILTWLENNPQDMLFLNGCEQSDIVIPYLTSDTKCIYVVHDTAPRYWHTAIAQEEHLEAIVAVSETVASQFRHHLKQPNKLSVILNGCVFPVLPKEKQHRLDSLIFLGGDNPTKGAFDTIRLWKELVKSGFEGKLHWFGHMTPNFKAQLEQLPRSDQIQVYGRVSREIIFSTAASAKVLLMMSRVEPFGMATIEAMSMGCVPVAWDIETGTKEIITANQTGLFAPLGNIRVLTKQVLVACQNYSVYCKAVIEHARSNFDESIMWQGYQFLIERISVLEPILRSKTGQRPTLYQPPLRRFQLLPPSWRSIIREIIGRSPRLGYWLRDLRGF